MEVLMKKYLPIVLLCITFFLAACRTEVQVYEPETSTNTACYPLQTLPSPTPPPTRQDLDQLINHNNQFPSLHITIPEHPFQQERAHWQRGGSLTLRTSPEFSFYSADVRIRGRGNSTWRDGSEKRPLRIRFETPQTFLDFHNPHRDWILIAELFDRSLFRNYAAFHLAGQLTSMHWIPYSRFVHLYINGEYYGVYHLTDERDNSRLNLIFDPDPTISEYFLELNGQTQLWRADEFQEGEDYFFVGVRPYEMRWPNNDLNGHLQYAQDFLQQISTAFITQDKNAIVRLIDIPSFIDFYLVQELFMNADIAMFSVFMQIRGQGENRRLYMGPVWDFDQSSGNVETVEWPTGRWVELHHYWFRNFLAIPEFRNLTAERWNEVKQTYLPQTINRINYLATTYEYCFLRNFTRFPNIFEGGADWNWINSRTVRNINNFQGQVEFLTEFLTTRAQWMTNFLNYGFTCLPVNLRHISVVVNEAILELDTPPIIIDDRVLIPACAIASALGTEFSWDAATRRATLYHPNGSHAIMAVDSMLVTIVHDPNGGHSEVIVLDTPVTLANDKILIPLRFFGDFLGATVEWNRSVRTAFINK